MKHLLLPLCAIALHAPAFAAEKPEPRSLFNGTDLMGWTGQGYIVEDGAIVCTPQGTNLMTEGIYASYVLEFEFKLPPGGNNGLGIHYPGEGPPSESGMELQVLDNTAEKYKNLKDYQFHGSLYTLAPADRNAPLKPVGEWNQQTVSVLGPAIKVDLNGQTILRANLDDLERNHPNHAGAKRRSGHIGFLGHGDRVAFRNIRITEVPPAAHEEGVKAAGFSPLIKGATLEGWKHTPDTENWFVHHGIVKHTGKKGPVNDLWSEKEYTDFTLVFDWRWSGRGEPKQQPVILPDGTQEKDAEGKPVTALVEELDSGVYLRGSTAAQVNLWNWTVGSGEVYGYRTNAAHPPEVRAGVTPSLKADRPLGEWNRTKITLIGDRLTVTINGETVISDAALPGIPGKGPIGLQHHGQAIDFANIWIKEL
jgi:hypothetical protein